MEPDSRLTPHPSRLTGVRVLVTRPAQQAEKLCRLIEAEGGVALRLPLLTIEPVTNFADAQRRLAGGHGTWIFTSANAVRHAQALIANAWPAQIAAVGPATAIALAGAGQNAALLPVTGASSDALLEMPEFQDVRGQRILIVTGEGGLQQLEQVLTARGASVERAEVYRRVPLPYPPEAITGALRKSDVIVVTSAEALEQLSRLTPDASRLTLFKKTLVVSSARVVEKARELGFTRTPRIAEPMSDTALCAACAPASE